MTGGWNLADIFETIAEALPDKPAQIQGERTFTWAEFNRRSDALAADFLAAGLSHQSKVSAYLYNCPEYLETYFAAFKASLIPTNTNYRYTASELKYLWENADAEAVVFHAELAPVIEEIQGKLTGVKRWYAVAGEGEYIPKWAHSYEAVVNSGNQPQPDWQRSGDDLLFLYTGGTTGMPKGVMWRQDDIFNVLGAGGNAVLGIPPVQSAHELIARLPTLPLELTSPYMPACPLMHGTGQFGAFIAMFGTRAVVTLEERKFDAHNLWQEVCKHQIGVISIVGDAFARPMLETLDQSPNEFDLSGVYFITSSGVMWSQENKAGLIKHMPAVKLIDALGSSEAVGLGNSLVSAETQAKTADFMPGARVHVFTDDNRELKIGDTEIGQVAVNGFLPVGYYKDPEKTAKTFRTINGVRYSIPGDFAQINPDGTIRLLGRGSACINTGGEKVFPEEVEEALKQHSKVADAVCVGVPDDRFGQAICAVIESTHPNDPPTLDELNETLIQSLARYKLPRHLVIDAIGRAANGKIDYKRHTSNAAEKLNLEQTRNRSTD